MGGWVEVLWSTASRAAVGCCGFPLLLRAAVGCCGLPSRLSGLLPGLLQAAAIGAVMRFHVTPAMLDAHCNT